MKIRLARCPVCNKSIPFWTHLFYGDVAGLLCPSCNSLIGHTLATKLVKYGLLVLVVVSLSYRQNGAIWWVVLVGSVIGLLYVQLFSRFKIIFKR